MTALPTVPTPRVPVTTTYHGVDVTEDYRWLEDGSSEETVRWTAAQQSRTRAYLDAIPWRPDLRARVEGLLRAASTEYLLLNAGGDLFFALKEQRPRQRPLLVALTDLDDPATERVVLDPMEVDPSGETNIDWFVPSPDGSRVAVSLSEHGDEDGTLHVYDVASGEHVGAPIPHVNVMGGSMTWRHDSGALWYTLPAEDRLPSAGLVPRPRGRHRHARPVGTLRRTADLGELPDLLPGRPLGDGPRAEG